MTTNEGKLWGGRFASGPSPELEALSRSTHFDWRLVPYDIAGSHAHALALARGRAALGRGRGGAARGARRPDAAATTPATSTPTRPTRTCTAPWSGCCLEEVGAELGGRLRAGRSRNDQIATLLRCYLLDHSLAPVAAAARPGRRAGDPRPRRTSVR